MSEISFDKHRSPVKAALLYLVLWELATVIMWLFTAKLFVIYPLFAVGFTVVYPVCTWWACYRHAKNYGLKWFGDRIYLRGGSKVGSAELYRTHCVDRGLRRRYRKLLCG